MRRRPLLVAEDYDSNQHLSGAADKEQDGQMGEWGLQFIQSLAASHPLTAPESPSFCDRSFLVVAWNNYLCLSKIDMLKPNIPTLCDGIRRKKGRLNGPLNTSTLVV